MSHGGTDDQPCPVWCTTEAQHLTFLMRHGMDDYWHEGVEHPHDTLDTDHNWIPQDLQVRLGQQERVDEHGHQRHPTYVDCGGGAGTFLSWRYRQKLRALCGRKSVLAEATTGSSPSVYSGSFTRMRSWPR